MLFNSYIFLFLFLPLAVAGYYGLQYAKRPKAALIFLTGMSFWFCGYLNPMYLVILLISILVNFGLAKGITATEQKAGRRALLALGLLVNIGALFYFKYYDFFIENVNAVFKTDFALLHLVMPLGVSFYTFQQIAYLVDSYKGECEKYSLLEYTAYAAFFPKLVQGPIMYHYEFILQLRKEENRRIHFDNLSKGIYSLSLGLAKKVLLADTLAKIVALGYEDIGELNAPSAALVMICYSLQIYFDFSGYCDMAYGIGYFFNMELPINFNSPYKAQSVRDFWDRWHMTLTRFFTKYVYIPLGGNRKGKLRTYGNIMTVFLVSGLWHGANWTFVLWGAMHGAVSVVERWKPSKKLLEKIPRVIRTAAAFCFVTFAWSLFRADSIAQAQRLWNRLLHGGWGQIYAPLTAVFNDMVEMKMIYRLGFARVITLYPSLFLCLFLLALLLGCFFMKNTQEKVREMKYTNRKIVVIVLLMLWSILSLSEVSAFLYANF